MVEFLLFRHGETDWNLQRIFQGHSNIPLNDTGKKQAEALAVKIQHWKPDIILSSDLSRAIQTGEASQKFWNVPIIQSSFLREMDLGKAEGLHRDEVIKMVGNDFEKWISHNPEDENFRFPGGESKAEARARILGFLEDFARKNPQYKKIAVSTHGGVLRRATHALPGTPAEGVAIPNCISYRLNFDGSQWYYVSVRERASVVVNHSGSLLAFFGVDPHSKEEYHFLPGGLIEQNETAKDCVERESVEETGYTVRAFPESTQIREYDFVWNGKAVWCRTHFLKGELVHPYDAPIAVQDADYNKGVVWVPEDEIEKYLGYEQSILDVVLKLIDSGLH